MSLCGFLYMQKMKTASNEYKSITYLVQLPFIICFPKYNTIQETMC